MKIGVFSLLGIVFVILKLCKIITWKWVWVLCPFWIGAILYLLLIVLNIILAIKSWK